MTEKPKIGCTPKQNSLPNGIGGRQGNCLGNSSNISCALKCCERREVIPVRVHLSACNRNDPTHRADQCRFACAVWPNKSKDFTALHVERNIVQNAAGTIRDGEILDF